MRRSRRSSKHSAKPLARVSAPDLRRGAVFAVFVAVLATFVVAPNVTTPSVAVAEPSEPTTTSTPPGEQGSAFKVAGKPTADPKAEEKPSDEPAPKDEKPSEDAPKDEKPSEPSEGDGSMEEPAPPAKEEEGTAENEGSSGKDAGKPAGADSLTGLLQTIVANGLIFFTDVSVPDRLETVWVVADAPGYLNAWIDYDRDGTFDPSERLFTDTPVVAGYNKLTYTVPTGSAFVAGTADARFRVADAAGQSDDPGAPGEVTNTTRELYDAQAVALEQCPAGTTPVPVSVIQNPSFEDRTQDFQNLPGDPTSTISYATNWYDDFPTGGQYHVFSPTFDSGPDQATMPVRAGADGYGFMGGHSGNIDGTPVGEGTTNILLDTLDPDATYVGFFSMAAGGYGRTGSGYMQFYGHSERAVGTPPSGPNTELLYQTPVVSYPGTAWELNTFKLDANKAWPYLRVEVRNENPANDGTIDGQVWMNFDDFHMYKCDPIQDFGDAPSSYKTLLDDDGPRHRVVDGLHLGANIDDENDGQPNAAADGDGADEDGVSGPITMAFGQQKTVKVSATNDTDEPATLAGWIDLDDDGSFSDDERKTITVPANTGTADYELTFPGVTQADGATFARFRLFAGEVDDPSPTGAATGGEIEDYQVSVSAPPLACDVSANGSFESPNIQGNPAAIYQSGSALYLTNQLTLNGWSVVDGTIDIMRWWANASDGEQSLDLWGDAPSTIQQTFSGLVPGATYTFSVDYSGAVSGVSAATVALDQGSGFIDLHTLTPSVTQTPSSGPPGDTAVRVTWSTYVYQFTASSSSATVQFKNSSVAGPAFTGLFIDNFQFGGACSDFGDAPDSFDTKLADNGPRHTIVDGVHLGSDIDNEADGQPNAAASGDGGDEDGVEFNPALGYANPTLRTGLDPQSQQPIENTLAVDASADGFVSAWVDWNMDGDWDDSGERVANGEPVTAGSNDITFPQGANPPGIETYVRVRYSTDADSITDPTGAAPDGEVEDYRVLVERLVQPDTCSVTDTDYYAFTFAQPDATDLQGTGAVGTTARYRNVTVIDGVAVDMYVEVIAGGTLSTGPGSAPPNGFWIGPGTDDAAWQIAEDATLRYKFYEAGTTTPVDVNAVFTVNDMDWPPGENQEIATWDDTDLAGYAVTQGSTVDLTQNGGSVSFAGNGFNNSDPPSRFQVVIEGKSTFEVHWQGFYGSGFGFDGDGDISITPACSDFGDAPDSYGTTLADNGPRHTIVDGLTIGSKIDLDTDGQPNAAADGDDSNGVADEDAFPSPIVLNPGVTNPTLTVPVTNTTGGAATLYGWIDSDNDGRFEISEFASVAVPDGATSVDLAFNGIPALSDGATPAVRLRLTTDTLTDNPITPDVDEAALGAATNGEVEDHLARVATLVPVSCSAPFTETFGAGEGFGPELPAGQTTYNYVGAPESDNQIDDGDYAIVQDPQDAHSNWVTGSDHTGDADGRFMIVNAGFSEGVFFQRTFTGLATGAPYDFAAYITSVLDGDGINANVTFRIVDPATGTVLSTVDTGEIPNNSGVDWDRYSLEFVASQPTVRLEMVNNADGGGGNDLAIDDISFSAVCEFGDAPNSYGTVNADDGAAHIATGPSLGTERDTESDGQPNAAADGDDSAGTPDDEDGVSAAIGMSVGAKTTVPVSATNDSDEDVTLAGWIDLDGDGQFEDAERVTVTAPANSGTVSYDLEFPAGTTTSDTYARFRIYGGVVADPKPTGTAPAGEVEDYTVTILPPGLVIEKSSDATVDSRPGDTITYTVTAENTGTGDYTTANPARVWDDMSGVLDDATYGGDASADRGGAPVYADPIISWTGALPAGETVTITYTVTLKGGGDGLVRNVAFEQCDPSDPDCDTVTPECDPPVGGVDPDTGKACAPEVFELPKLSITKVADRTDLPELGETVEYTVTVKNEGPGDYTAAKPGTISDDMSDVIDSTTDPDNITASVGTAAFSTPSLTWTGALGSGDSATITYEVTYLGGGDQQLDNNACVPVTEAQDPQDPCATVQIPGSGLDRDKVANPASGTPVVVGEEVTYTLRFDNTGQTAATVDTFDDLSDVLDDAEFVAGSITADAGLTATFDGPGEQIDIIGSVPVGGSLEVTYKVKVKAWSDQDNHVLRNALQCQDGDPASCEPDVTEHPVPHITDKKTVDPADRTAVKAGDELDYTLTFTNDGEAAGAVSKDDFVGMLLDDAEITSGPTVSDPSLTATVDGNLIKIRGTLDTDDVVTVKYTVTVKSDADRQDDGGDDMLGNFLIEPGTTPPTACEPEADEDSTCNPVSRITDEKSVDPADRTAVKAGDELDYTLTFVNDGKGDGAVSKDDFVGMLLDDAEITSGPTVSDPSLTATVDGNLIKIRGTLGAGDTVTVTYTATVKSDADRQDDGGDDMLGNFLIEPGITPPDGCLPESDEDSTCNPVSRIVDEKSVDPADGSTVKAGDELTYTLTFENLGKATGSVDKDDFLGMLLDDAEIVSGPTVAGQGNLTATVDDDVIEVRGTLGAGDKATVTYKVKVKSDADRAADGDDMLGNFLIVPGTTPPTACEPTSDEDSTCNPIPRITDEKSVDPEDGSTVVAGDELTYTLTFENEGEADGTVSKDDYVGMLLDDAEIISGPTSSDASLTATLAGDLIKIRGTLKAGDTVTVTYKVKVKSDADRAADGDDMLGNFLIEPGTTPPTACEPEAEEDSTCNPIPRIVDKKSVDPADGSTVVAGEELEYTLTFTNDGKAEGDVSKDDFLGMLLDDAEIVSGPTVAGQGNLTASLDDDVIEVRGTLGAGDKATVTYKVKVKSDADRAADGDDMLGNFLIEPGTTPPDECLPTEDEDSTCNPIPRIVDSKSVDPADGSTVLAGDELEYTLTFENEGKGSGTVSKDDYLGMLLDDAEIISGPTVAGQGSLTATLKGDVIEVRGDLGAGDKATVTYTVKVKSDADRAADGDDMLGNFLIEPGTTPPDECLPESDEDSTCNPASRIVDEKSVDPEDGSTVVAGDELTYTLTFENLGKAEGTVSKDDFVGMLLDDAEIVSGPTVAGQGNLTATLNVDRFEIRGTLGAGDKATVTYTVKVKSDADRAADGDDMLGNFLIEPGTTPPDECLPTEDEDSTCNPVPRIVDWKSVTPSSKTPVVAGQQLTYTLTFTNRGEATGEVDKVDYLKHILDDADFVTGPTVSDPALSANRDGDEIEITGELAKGQTVTVSYTVEVKSDKNRDADGGDDILANFLIKPDQEPPTDPGDCVPAEGEDADCTVNPVGEIRPSKSVNPKTGTTVKDGQVLTYTLSFENPGKGEAKLDYTDHMAGVLDDATLTGGPKASTGLTVSGPTGGKLHVTGVVAAGETATVVYKVKVKGYDDQGNHHLGNFVTVTGEKPPTECVAANPLCTENPIDPPPPGGWLPNTGGPTLVLLGLAALALVGGGALLIGARRRRTTESTGRRIG